MEMIWIAMLALAVLVIEAFRFSRIEKYQLQCEQSLHELRAHHDVLMRQTGKRLEGEYSKRIDGLMAQVANRDGVVEGLEEKLKVLESNCSRETSRLRTELERSSEFCQVIQKQLRESHEREEALRIGMNKAKELLTIAE
jgi:hypothetical protein